MTSKIIFIVLLLSVFIPPTHAQARNLACSDELFEVGVNVAQFDEFPQGNDPKYWEYSDKWYVTSYHLSSSYKVLKVVSLRGGNMRLVGLYRDNGWIWCEKDTHWKQYLMQKGN